MIQEQINRLVATLQALTLQRVNALRAGNQSEADQIQSVSIDIDSKIHELQKPIKMIEVLEFLATYMPYFMPILLVFSLNG